MLPQRGRTPQVERAGATQTRRSNVGAGHCPPFARSAKTRARDGRVCRSPAPVWPRVSGRRSRPERKRLTGRARGRGPSKAKPRQSRTEGKVLPSVLLLIICSPGVTAHATSTNPLSRISAGSVHLASGRTPPRPCARYAGFACGWIGGPVILCAAKEPPGEAGVRRAEGPSDRSLPALFALPTGLGCRSQVWASAFRS